MHPHVEVISRLDCGDFQLSHAIWHYGYLTYPETGVRFATARDFEVIPHGTTDFGLASNVIVRGLIKGWRADRMNKLIQWLDKRERRKRLSKIIIGEFGSDDRRLSNG
jgi:hypothetical protein